MKPRIRNSSPVATLFVAFALAGAPTAFGVNAAWNTDAATGDFGSPNWTSGVTIPAAGGTYTVVSGDALFFGTSTTTTLNNNLSGATYAGLTFNSGASAFTIGGNSFTLTNNIVNNSTSLQTINNDMTSTAARIFSGGTGGLTLSGTYTTAVAATYRGIVNITGATTISQGGGNNQGFATFGDGPNSATVTISNGGSLSINGTTAGGKPNTIVANNVSTSALNVGASDQSSSGTLTVGAETGFVLGNNNTSANGTLNINSGTATINSGGTAGSTDIRSFVALGRDTGTGTINLNGGTLATGRNFVRDGSATADTLGAANFVFAGGTLKALANQTDWLNSSTKNTNQLALSSVTTTSANSTIDSNGFSVAINNAISGSGGFDINSSTGTGTVTFGGTNSYTGATIITNGTFALASTGSLASTQITAASGSTFDVSAVSGYTVGSGVTLTNNGTVNGSFTVASGATLNGSGTFNNAVTVNGALNPGNSPGTQTYASGLTLGAASTTTMEIAGLGGVAGTDFDFINATGGTLTFDGALAIVDFGGFDISAQTGTYNLFDGTTAGDFDVVTVDGNSLVYNGGTDDWSATSGLVTYNFAEGTGVLSVTVVPEPTAALLGGLGLLGLLRRRRVA